MGRFHWGVNMNQKRPCVGCRKQDEENMEIKYLKERLFVDNVESVLRMDRKPGHWPNLWKSNWMAATLDYCEWARD